jgi:hypothetical protein
VPDDNADWKAFIATLSEGQLTELITFYADLRRARIAQLNRKTLRRAQVRAARQHAGQYVTPVSEDRAHSYRR